jgi:GntR family transcriptional regulator
MFENINIQSNVAVYIQIKNHSLFAVASGGLKAGERLPSINDLAKKLDVNQNTVAKGYRELESMGITRSRRGMGVFINQGVEAKVVDECRRRILSHLHEVVAEAKAANLSAQEIKQVCTKSFALDAPLYGETPDAILALARTKNG